MIKHHSDNEQTSMMFEDGSFFRIEAAEILCMVCLPQEEHIFRKK